jgi:hypothetical protein
MKSFAACLAIVALCGVPQAAAAQTGTAPFCLQTPTGTRCTFGTMGDCENARAGTSSSQCITGTDARGTTGLGDPPAKPSATPTPPPPAAQSYGR